MVGPVPPPSGGIATHVALLSAGLERAGYTVHIHALGSGALGSVAHRLGKGSGWVLASQLLASLPRRSIVHTHSVFTTYPGFRLLEIFVRAIESKRATWIETIHDSHLPERFAAWTPVDRARYSEALQRAHAVVAVSKPLREFLVDLGLDPARVHQVGPLLPDTSETGPRLASLDDFVARHTPILAGVGAMIALYDFGTIADAFIELRRAGGRAGLILLNSTFAADQSFADELYSRLAPARQDVLALTDVPSAQARAAMALADVVVRGPAQESYGLSRVEAMLAGTPVVATAVGEQEFIFEYRHADPVSLQAAIDRALSADPAWTEAARSHFQGQARANLEELLTLYGDDGR